MVPEKLFSFAIVLLVLLAVVMIVIGINAGIVPPILTGVGFLLIAYISAGKKSKS